MKPVGQELLPSPREMDMELMSTAIRRARVWPYLLIGLIVATGMMSGIGWWSVNARLDGAVIAPAEFAVETKRKKLQHPEGGVVREILVGEGDRVEAGQVVLKLDSTVEQASFAVIQNELRQLKAQRIRLIAEQKGVGRIDFSEALSGRVPDARTARIIQGQEELFLARLTSRTSEADIRKKRIRKLNQEIEGLRRQIRSNQRQVKLVNEELEGLRILEKEKLVPRGRLLALSREAERIKGQSEALNVSVVRAFNSIDEVKLQAIQAKNQFEEQITTELRTIEPRLTQLSEQIVTARQKLAQVEVRAPASGYVVNLKANTPGGVVQAGEDIMDIVPEGEKLIVEARVGTGDIDKIRTGSSARVQLTAFDQTVTPEASGRVLSVSADSLKDERSGQSYYLARLELEKEQSSIVDGLALVPGMPATVFIQTGARTPLSYFLKPLNDRLKRTFVEG